MIELSGLRAGYRGTEVLHGIDLHIEKGEIVSVIGPNGCGKTTLLKAMCGLGASTGGSVHLSGRELSSYSRRELARLAAFLPQTRDVPAISVESLTAHGRYPHLSFGRSLTENDREIIARAMEAAGIAHLRNRELSSLSGGQRQRAYLAMTLAQETDLLFLDEPTTYLDVGQKFEVMQVLCGIREMGKTVVMVLHDLPLAFSFSNKVAVLHEGCIAAFGSPQEVFSGGAVERVFSVQAQQVLLNGETQYLFSGNFRPALAHEEKSM